MDQATLSNVPADGICVDGNTNTTALTPLRFTQTTISGVVGAAIRRRSSGLGALLTADGLRLVNNGWGIHWTGGSNSVVDLRNSTISGSTVVASGGAIYFEPQNVNQGVTLKLRDSGITGNLSDGLFLGQIATSSVDLGTSADPGGNTFTGNATTSAHIGAFAGAGGRRRRRQHLGLGPAGRRRDGRYSAPPGYTPVPKTGVTSGANYTIESAASTLNL